MSTLERKLLLPTNLTDPEKQDAQKTAFGVRLEHPSFDNVVFRTMIPIAELSAKIRHADVEGSLPPTGPGIVIANHSSYIDTFFVYWLALRAGRTIRWAARANLLDPTIKEEPEVLERIGEKKDVFNGKPGHIMRVSSWFVKKAGNPIPVHRGKPRPSFFKEIHKTLKNDQLFGIFIEETRDEENKLRNPMEGPAAIAKRYPDVAISLVGLDNIALNGNGSFFHPRARIAPPTTWNEMIMQYAQDHNGEELTVKSATEIFAERISELMKPQKEKTIYP